MSIPTASSIDLNPHDLLEVLQVLDTYLPGVEVRAFGSRVRWTAKPYSDLDLALMTNQPLSLDQAAQLREALDETTLPFKVDVVDWSSTSETFRDIIQSNNVIIRPASTVATEQWAAMTLDEALETLLDYRGKTPEKTTSGIPLITAKIVKNGRIETPTEFIGIEDYDAWMTRGLPKAGDVVLTTEAPLGEVAQLDNSRVALAQRIVVLRGKSGLLDNTYLRYLLQTYEMQEQLASRATGTTVVGIKQSELRKISLRFPPISRQVAVANMLSTLDDKIELNRRMNETLEAMARAIFQSWFVDFDPVRAKASGESADSICQRLGLTPELLALFPDSFEDSELGEIPSGWVIESIGTLANVTGGSTPNTKEPKYWDAGVHYWATPKDLSRLSSPVLLETERKVSDEGLAQIGSGLLTPGTVLLSSRAPIGYRAINEVPVAVNQGFIAMAPNSGVSKYFLLYWAEWAHDEIVSRANGSTFLEISKSNFRPIPVVRPTDDLFEKFDQYVGPLYKRIVSNEQETQLLVAQRNSLLPKLLSGEVPVAAEEDAS